MIACLRRPLPVLLVALAMFAAFALLVVGCGGDSKKTASAPASSVPRTSGGCEQVQPPQQRDPGKQRKPRRKLDPSKRWSLTFRTNCGDFTVALDLRAAPNASASLVSLARAGYFDNTVFHRIAPGFVIQGGDPTATGSGGPGYTTVDRPPADASYTHGVVAMAKAGNEPPGAGGSQFFVVTGPDAGLPPDYAVLGRVSKGLDVVDRIGQLGNQAEQPTEIVVIRGVDVSTG
jgi:peptidyl-prolyl cis-trans isomerase B (cyclophilin B)